MTNNIDIKKRLTRRAFVFGAASGAAISVVVGRLYYLQFVKNEVYKTMAEGNRVKLQLIAPVRGQLLDRNGVALASNHRNFRLYLDTESKVNAKKSLTDLARLLDIGSDHIDEVLEQAKETRHQPPILIKEHLTRDELAQFEFYQLNYPGVFLDVGQTRYYPFAENASHLIGYVGGVAQGEEKDQSVEEQELQYLPDYKVGKNGVEKTYELRLRGVAGVKQQEVNVHGTMVRELSRKEGTAGENINLTIDSRLQEYAAARLAGQSAAAVVMNVHNGDVLALASVPSYDPNSFSKGITPKYWGELQANPKVPLMNKAISGQYPPGSTIKPCMGLAALEAKVINEQSRVFCDGHFTLGNHSFACWKKGGHGSVNLQEALKGSCDVFFYTMANRMGIDNIAAMARKLGLGKATGIGLPAERGGIVPDDAWKRKKGEGKWQPGDSISVGIGQGYLIATPLQLATMLSRIANGGYEVSPRLVATDDKNKEPRSLGIAEDYLAAICEGLNTVVNVQGGTAYGSRIQDERFTMGGKTGTAQVRKVIEHGGDQNKLPWEARDHAWFIGFAPVAAPKYAAAVIVEHGGHGASVSAPIVRDLLLKQQAMDAGEPGPELPKVKKEGDEEVD